MATLRQTKKSGKRIEFGDFQTPETLARDVCGLLFRRGVRPRTIIEPTCGQGVFVCEAMRRFPAVRRIVGLDVNRDYVRQTRKRIRALSSQAELHVSRVDFFSCDWRQFVADEKEPILVIGNPPWVNNSQLGAIGGSNHPRKTNQQGVRGIEAITGKSNFDVSEWMLNTLLEALDGRHATLAMLCKTSVARKTLHRAWKSGFRVIRASLHGFDANSAFGVSVDACLLVCRLGDGSIRRECSVYTDLRQRKAARSLGYREGRLISNLKAYRRWGHLAGESKRRWRSGIKHDCSRVMELRRRGSKFCNGLGETVEIEGDCIYPLLKSSHLSRGSQQPDRWMIVPQRAVGADTKVLRRQAPKTWRYLMSHADRLDARASAVYRNRPRFSIFGVGEYSFSPWKVAISGFYKTLRFAKVGSHGGKPIVLDDTCCSLSCRDEAEVDELMELLNGPVAREFFSAFIFWDAKRPVTIEVLQMLDLEKLRRAK